MDFPLAEMEQKGDDRRRLCRSCESKYEQNFD